MMVKRLVTRERNTRDSNSTVSFISPGEAESYILLDKSMGEKLALHLLLLRRYSVCRTRSLAQLFLTV